MRIRVGTRASNLAKTQTKQTLALLEAANPGVEFVLQTLSSEGDQDRKSRFVEFTSVGLFTKMGEEALAEGEVDMVVHSLKDLPTTLMEGLTLAAVPVREDPTDALCGATLDALPSGARVGTGSLRRQAQLLRLRPDLTIKPIRGNVPTRLRQVRPTGSMDAVVLATAGLNRLGWGEHVTERLDPLRFLPAPAQGALALETRADDADTTRVIASVDCADTHLCAEAERRLLNRLHGGCTVPVGAFARVLDDGSTHLAAVVTQSDGSRWVEGEVTADRQSLLARAEALAEDLLSRGAGEILAKDRAAAQSGQVAEGSG